MPGCVENFVIEAEEELKFMCQRFLGRDGSDMWQDMCVEMLTNPKYEKLCEDGKLRFYLIRVINIAKFSTTSPFHTKYRKHVYKNNLYEFPDGVPIFSEEWISSHRKYQQGQVEEALKTITWFDAQVFKIYYLEGHTYKSLAHATGINKDTIGLSVRRAAEAIKEEIEKKGKRSWRHGGVDSEGDRD